MGFLCFVQERPASTHLGRRLSFANLGGLLSRFSSLTQLAWFIHVYINGFPPAGSESVSQYVGALGCCSERLMGFKNGRQTRRRVVHS